MTQGIQSAEGQSLFSDDELLGNRKITYASKITFSNSWKFMNSTSVMPQLLFSKAE